AVVEDAVVGDTAAAGGAAVHPRVRPERRLSADLQLGGPVEVPSARTVVARGALLDDRDRLRQEVLAAVIRRELHVVPVEAPTCEQRQAPALVVQPPVQELTVACRCMRGKTATESEVEIVLQHDVDDSAEALGVMSRGRIGHDLDPLDAIAGKLLQEICELLA